MKIIFINKLDSAGANPWQALEQIKVRLGLNVAAVQIPIGIETTLRGIVDLVKMKAIYFDGNNGEYIREEEIPEEVKADADKYRNELIERLADIDDFLLPEELNYIDFYFALLAQYYNRNL